MSGQLQEDRELRKCTKELLTAFVRGRQKPEGRVTALFWCHECHMIESFMFVSDIRQTKTF